MGIGVLSDAHQNFFRRASEFRPMGIGIPPQGEQPRNTWKSRNWLGWDGLLPLKTQKAALRHTERGGLGRPRPCGRTRKAAKALRDTKVGAGYLTTEYTESTERRGKATPRRRSEGRGSLNGLPDGGAAKPANTTMPTGNGRPAKPSAASRLGTACLSSRVRGRARSVASEVFHGVPP